MRASDVERSGIVRVFGVSRRDDVGADVAGGASFVDNRDILLDWKEVSRFRLSYSSTLRFRTVDNLTSGDGQSPKSDPWQAMTYHPQKGNTLSRPGLVGHAGITFIRLYGYCRKQNIHFPQALHDNQIDHADNASYLDLESSSL